MWVESDGAVASTALAHHLQLRILCPTLLTMNSMALDISVNFTFQNGKNNENMVGDESINLTYIPVHGGKVVLLKSVSFCYSGHFFLCNLLCFKPRCTVAVG